MYENHELVREPGRKIDRKIIVEILAAERDEAGFGPRGDLHL